MHLLAGGFSGRSPRPANGVSGSSQCRLPPDSTKHRAQLRALVSLPHGERVPDGVVPCALAPLLGLLGMGADDRKTCIHQLAWAILRAVATINFEWVRNA